MSEPHPLMGVANHVKLQCDHRLLDEKGMQIHVYEKHILIEHYPDHLNGMPGFAHTEYTDANIDYMIKRYLFQFWIASARDEKYRKLLGIWTRQSAKHPKLGETK